MAESASLSIKRGQMFGKGPVVVKACRRNKDNNTFKLLEKELKFMWRCRSHPGILGVLGYLKHRRFKGIVLEQAHGTLRDTVQNLPPKVGYSIVGKVMRV